MTNWFPKKGSITPADPLNLVMWWDDGMSSQSQGKVALTFVSSIASGPQERTLDCPGVAGSLCHRLAIFLPAICRLCPLDAVLDVYNAQQSRLATGANPIDKDL